MKAVVNLGATTLSKGFFFIVKLMLYAWYSRTLNPHSV